MKKSASILFVLSLLVVCLCLSEGCSKAKSSSITACIDPIPGTISAGGTLTFMSCTVGGISYVWNFGDGNTANGDSVVYTYNTAGTYNGSLTVSDASSSSVQKFTITVVPNSWTFNGVNYSIDSVTGTRLGATLSATGTSGGKNAKLTFKFYPYPTVSGVYTVVDGLYGPKLANQMLVTFSTDSAGIQNIFVSTGGGPVLANVTVGGGLLNVYLPATEMMNTNNLADSLSLSASIAQTH